jgi:hypothetical protein
MRTGKKNSVILVANKLDINRKEKDYDTAIAEYYKK